MNRAAAGVFREFVMRGLRPLSFRGKARLLTRLLPGHGRREAHIHGCRMRLDLADHIQRHVYMGTFERAETKFASRWLRAGDVFVDVGANVGYYVALAARCVGPQGRVAAFEPSSYAYDRLCDLIRDNGLHWASAIAAAAGATSGHAELPAPSPANHTPSLLEAPEGRVTARVPLVRLDDMTAAWEGRPIDLLKLDVEGYEKFVLDGASDLLARQQIRAILCEFNEYWLLRAGSSISDLMGRLQDAGFEPEPRSLRARRELDGATLPLVHHSAWERLRP